MGNGDDGVSIQDNADNNTIGGTGAAEGNLISGNGDDGVSMEADADNNTVGGTSAAKGNIISGNGGDGVEVKFSVSDSNGGATGNSILSNSIYDNDFLGIDLINTNKPPGDTDTGPNNLQNYPEITSARLAAVRIDGRRRKVTIIKGTQNSEDGEIYNVQFFGSPEADNTPDTLTGYGEGKRFLGQKSVTTDENGDATFTFKTRKKVPKGQVVTSTVTNQATGDTSEFSEAVIVS